MLSMAVIPYPFHPLRTFSRHFPRRWVVEIALTCGGQGEPCSYFKVIAGGWGDACVQFAAAHKTLGMNPAV